MSHKRGYARLAARYKRGDARLTTRYGGDIRVCLACGPAYRCAHAGYMLRTLTADNRRSRITLRFIRATG
jgi:hypothetical protein